MSSEPQHVTGGRKKEAIRLRDEEIASEVGRERKKRGRKEGEDLFYGVLNFYANNLLSADQRENK